MSSNDDSFLDGLLTAVVFGLAAYGTYKVIENLTKSPEQRLLENLGRDLKSIDAGYGHDMRQIPYDGGDDEE